MTCVTTVLLSSQAAGSALPKWGGHRPRGPWGTLHTTGQHSMPSMYLCLGQNQLQPEGCTQPHHLNEGVPLRLAPSSGAAPLELEPSAGTHLSPTTTHASKHYTQTTFSQMSTLGRKRLPPGAKCPQMPGFRNCGIAANEWAGTPAAALCNLVRRTA